MTPARILLVDDDPALLSALPEVVRLRMPFVTVDACDTAAAALARAAVTDYDAVVTDVKMPGMDGLALLDEMRALRPDTPTLLITGHGEHDLAVRALRGGAYDFIQKPIDRDYLVACLSRAVRMRQLSREVERQKAALERHAGELERVVEARTRELSEANRTKDHLLLREQAARADAEAAQRRLAFLADVSSQLTRSLDYPATLASLAQLVVPGLADWSAVDVVEEDGSVREVAVVRADPSKPEPAREAVLRTVLSTGRSELLERSDASCMCVPLVARGRTLGTLTLVAAGSGRRYGTADLALAEDLARRAALAVDNARLYQEAQTAVRVRDAFLARASHELRTPLTSAFGTIRLLKTAMSRGLTEDPESLIDIASRNLTVMATFIDDLLDASKLGAGRETLVLEPVEVAAVVKAGLEVVGAQAREADVRLHVAVPPRLLLRADRLKLEQVVVNLLANAIKFTPPGGEVTVEAEADARVVVIRVRDTGEGIAPEQLGAIFEPFVQATQARHERRVRRRGSGLGLAICRQIVALHGGTIAAESKGPGRGSTFTVTLPLAVAEGRAA